MYCRMLGNYFGFCLEMLFSVLARTSSSSGSRAELFASITLIFLFLDSDQGVLYCTVQKLFTQIEAMLRMVQLPIYK